MQHSSGYCTGCGAQLQQGDGFCRACGQVVLKPPDRAEQIVPRSDAASQGTGRSRRRGRIALLSVGFLTLAVVLLGVGALSVIAFGDGLGLAGGEGTLPPGDRGEVVTPAPEEATTPEAEQERTLDYTASPDPETTEVGGVQPGSETTTDGSYSDEDICELIPVGNYTVEECDEGVTDLDGVSDYPLTAMTLTVSTEGNATGMPTGLAPDLAYSLQESFDLDIVDVRVEIDTKEIGYGAGVDTGIAFSSIDVQGLYFDWDSQKVAERWNELYG